LKSIKEEYYSSLPFSKEISLTQKEHK
jgi:hypothetical protein